MKQRQRHGAVVQEHLVHRFRVVVGADLQQMVAHGAQDFHFAPGQADRQNQAIQLVVGGAPFIQSAQRFDEPLLCRTSRDAIRCARRMNLIPIEIAFPVFGKLQRDAHFVGHLESQVVQGLECFGQAERVHGIEVKHDGFRRAGDDAHFDALLEAFQMLQVIRDHFRRRDFAVQAAAGFVRDVALETGGALRVRRILRQARPTRGPPMSRQRRDDGTHGGFIDRVLQPVQVKIIEQQADGAAVRKSMKGHRAEVCRRARGEYLSSTP